jgi:hypothetical protein
MERPNVPQDQANSPGSKPALGLASFLLGLLGLVIVFLYIIESPLLWRLDEEVLIPAGIVASVIGFALGIADIILRKRATAYSIVGIVLGLLLLLAFLFGLIILTTVVS